MAVDGLAQIKNNITACKKRLAALPISDNKPSMDVGNYLVPVWRIQDTVREDGSVNIIHGDYNNSKNLPNTVAMFVDREEANFIINAPMDMSFLLTMTEHATEVIAKLQEKIKQLESEISKTPKEVK